MASPSRDLDAAETAVVLRRADESIECSLPAENAERLLQAVVSLQAELEEVSRRRLLAEVSRRESRREPPAEQVVTQVNRRRLGSLLG